MIKTADCYVRFEKMNFGLDTYQDELEGCGFSKKKEQTKVYFKACLIVFYLLFWPLYFSSDTLDKGSGGNLCHKMFFWFAYRRKSVLLSENPDLSRSKMVQKCMDPQKG